MIIDEDDWLVECLDALRPGWRGRIVLLRDTEALDGGDGELLFGTVVEGPEVAHNPETEEPIDATYVIASNYRDGEFVANDDERRRVVRVSEILEIEEM